MGRVRALSMIALGLTACRAANAPRPERDATWEQTVARRIAADARSIYARGDGFGADLVDVGAHARFSRGEVTLVVSEGTAFTLRTAGWGRSHAAWSVDASPTLGACTDEVDPAGRCIRRLERAAPGITEWWVGRGDGLEQGWDVARRPDGEGPLRMEVRVTGARSVEQAGEGATILDAGGLAWAVGGVSARDAAGRALPTRVEVVGDRIVFLVEDKEARYPLVVDPTYTTAEWTDIAGGAVGAGLGTAVAAIGDVNGDGYGDAAVSAIGWRGYTGAVYVYLGAAVGLGSDASVRLRGAAEDDLFGTALAGATDVDGDGYDDVIIGAPGANAGAGAASVYLGSATGPAETAVQTWAGEDAANNFGASVAGVGDVDGDGFGEVIVGAWGYDALRGRAYVYAGAAAGPGPTATSVITGEKESNYLGMSVSGAGDVNGDGYADVIVGAHGYVARTGRAYLCLGAPGGLESEATVREGSAYDDAFGGAVVGVGDLDGDGFDDVAIGAYGASGWLGQVYTFHGGAAGLEDSPRLTLTGSDVDTYFGQDLGAVGDVDGDGHADLAVGAYASLGGAGQAYVYLGADEGLSDTPNLVVGGDSAGAALGKALSGGDLNGDGYDELLVGAPGSAAGAGRAYVFAGGAAGVSATPLVTWTGESTSSAYGAAVAGVGDVDGDGYDDLLVGAYGYASNTGRVYGFAGGAGGVSDTARWVLEGEDPGEYFGMNVAGLGDVNGDGYADVGVGAHGASGFIGRVDLFLGGGSGLGVTPSAQLHGEASPDVFGCDVEGAGDVDGDGYADVLVGAYGVQLNRGAAYLFRGGAAGVAEAAATTLLGEWVDDHFGAALAGAGDVDGDGYGDVVIGAYGYGTNRGRAYVYRGGASGLAETPATTLDGVAQPDTFGETVGGAGDVNGDGHADVLVGAPNRDNGRGVAYVFHGNAGGVDTVATTTIPGEAPADDFGGALAGVGDLEGDGYDDVVIGAHGWGGYTGRAYVHAGTAAGLRTTAEPTLDGDTLGSAFGGAVDGAGDVDGDGHPDVVVGAYREISAAVYRGFGEDTGETGETGDSGETGAPTDTAETADPDSGTETADTADTADTDGVVPNREAGKSTPSGCGCATGGGPGAAVWSWGVIAALLRVGARRSRSDQASRPIGDFSIGTKPSSASMRPSQARMRG